MKQQDIAALILIVSISLVISYFVGNAIFATDSDRTAEVETVLPISAEFIQPDQSIYNNQAINTTETINIGDSTSNNPFSSN